MWKFVVFTIGLPQFLTKTIIFHTAFNFLTFWFSHLWQNIIPKLVFLCEYLWLIKAKLIALFFPWIPMTYAIIINIGFCMWSPSVVSRLGEKGVCLCLGKTRINMSALVLCAILWLQSHKCDNRDFYSKTLFTLTYVI